MAKSKDDDKEKAPFNATDIEAAKDNVNQAVEAFNRQWMSMPRFRQDCVVMDQGQLRDAMGLRATWDVGDPWPSAEQQLLRLGFRWHNLGGMRVMYLRERDNYEPDDGWNDGEEVDE